MALWINRIKPANYTDFKKNLSGRIRVTDALEAIEENSLDMVDNVFGVFRMGELQGILRYHKINKQIIDIEYIKGLYVSNQNEIELYCLNYIIKIAHTEGYKTLLYSGEDERIRNILLSKGFRTDRNMYIGLPNTLRLNFEYDLGPLGKMQIV